MVIVALAMILVAAALAIDVWRMRDRAPRSFGLAVMALTCTCAGSSLFDPPLPMHRTHTSLDELDEELSSPIWWLWPRGTITVEVTQEERQRELDVGHLIERALARGARIDVVPAAADDDLHVEQRAAVRLIWKPEDGPEVALPDTVSFVESGSDSVRPWLGDESEVRCRMDDGEFTPRPDLEELFARNGKNTSIGFHRIECRTEGLRGVRYVHVSDRGMVIARRAGAEEIPKGWLLDEDVDVSDPHLHGLLLTQLADVDAPPRTADVLVLEHPRARAACEAGRAVLDRGGTVVLADPDATFLRQCPELALVTDVDDSWRRVDRRPRLSVVIDRTMDDLEQVPSCRFDEQRCLVRGNPAPNAPSSSHLQLQRARELCTQALEAGGAGTEACERMEATATRCPPSERSDPATSRSLVRTMCKPERSVRATDEQRRDATSLHASLATLLQGSPDDEPLHDNRVTLVFPHVDPRLAGEGDRRCDHAERAGGRVLATWMRDRYGEALTAIAERTGWRERDEGCPTPARLTITPYSESMPWPPDAVVDLFRASSRLQAEASAIDRGRFRSHEELLPAPIWLRTWTERGLRTPPSGLPPVVASSTVERDGLETRVLGAGTLVGRGHLLLLGYSPFEFVDGEVPMIDREPSASWKDARPAARSGLGSAVLRALYTSTARFGRTAPGSVLGVDEATDGRVSIRVIRSIEDGVDELATLEVSAKGSKLMAPLVDVDVSRRTFAYLLSRSDIEALASGHRCVAVTVRPSGAADEPTELTVCRPEDAERERLVLAGEPTLRALAAFTGGCHAGEPCEPDRGGGPHAAWIGGTALGLLGLWGVRVYRRLLARRTMAAIEAAEARAQDRHDRPEALVAAEGAWGLQTSTWPRTGAAGGFRPLEPGDRPSAVLPRDLLLMSQGELAVLPTVALRVVEAAPATKVLVSFGATMRVPLVRGEAPKLHTSLHVADLVLSAVWQRRGSACLHAVGLARDEILVETTALHPGSEAIMAAATRGLDLAPAERWPWSTPVEAGVLVYVSDFMQEDPQALERWLRDIEASGVRVGGVLVYSPAELAMVEGGTLASSGVWVDRSDWTPADLERAFRRRVDHLEAMFDITSGGLTVVDTTMTTDELATCLAGRRLAEVLR